MHDPLCQASLNGNDDIFFCVCEFIAKVRADERAASTVRELTAEIRTLTWIRAKVEAMPPARGWFVKRQDVLDLIDGGSE